MGIRDRLQHAWNAFIGRDPTFRTYDYGPSYSRRPDRWRLSRGNERSIIASIYNRIAMDVAAVNIVHARIDQNGRYLSQLNTGLNNCLTLSANIDQTSRALMHDVVYSMLDEGSVAIVPVDTSDRPTDSNIFDVLSLRCGKITAWYPRHVKVQVYNERSGKKEEIVLPKSMVAIVENPFYAVMNEPNSTLQRLMRKLAMLDAVDEQSSSGKLDIIIQLPYVIKSKAREEEAERRRKQIEMQLSGSKYGIAYIDGTERITQLNRAAENNLLKQIEFLTNMLYGQLGISQSIFDGTADEAAMLNYKNRTIEPILSAIVNEMKRKWLTKTARTQGQSIYYYSDPFKLVPVSQIAEIADKFTRNEILTSNEVRQIIGYKPSSDPKADQLRNKNLNEKEGAEEQGQPGDEYEYDDTDEYTEEVEQNEY